MKKYIITAALLTGLSAGGLSVRAQDQRAEAKAKPHPLKTCVVSDEEIGKDPDMKPHTFAYKGQKVKLCCSGCKTDFDKDPAKYLKKIDDAATGTRHKRATCKHCATFTMRGVHSLCILSLPRRGNESSFNRA